MTSVSPAPASLPRPHSDWVDVLRARELWAGLSIAAMWLAVLIAAVYGGSFVSSDSTSIPSAIFIAFFACLGTVAVARHGFRDHRE